MGKFIITEEEKNRIRGLYEQTQQITFKVIGIKIGWKGNGINEVGYNKSTMKSLVKIDKDYFRPNEVHDLRGDFKKARKILKWSPKTSLDKMIYEMVWDDIKKLKN